MHPRLVYALLFEAVWPTLSKFAANPKRLGGHASIQTPTGQAWQRFVTGFIGILPVEDQL